MTEHTCDTCDTCAHAEPHGAGFIECGIAGRKLGDGVRFYCAAKATCYWEGEWKQLLRYRANAEAA